MEEKPMQGRCKVSLLLATASILGIAARSDGGDMIIGAKDGAAAVTSPDGKFAVSVTPGPVAYLAGPSEADLKALKDEYGAKWTFNTAKAPEGTFNILQYSPFAQAA